MNHHESCNPAGHGAALYNVFVEAGGHNKGDEEQVGQHQDGLGVAVSGDLLGAREVEPNPETDDNDDLGDQIYGRRRLGAEESLPTPPPGAESQGDNQIKKPVRSQ